MNTAVVSSRPTSLWVIAVAGLDQHRFRGCRVRRCADRDLPVVVCAQGRCQWLDRLIYAGASRQGCGQSSGPDAGPWVRPAATGRRAAPGLGPNFWPAVPGLRARPASLAESGPSIECRIHLKSP